MSEEALKSYLELSDRDIREQLVALLARPLPTTGRRQPPFLAIETLLCYGLFSVRDQHHYGGGNIETVPEVVKTLAVLFRRRSNMRLAANPVALGIPTRISSCLGPGQHHDRQGRGDIEENPPPYPGMECGYHSASDLFPLFGMIHREVCRHLLALA